MNKRIPTDRLVIGAYILQPNAQTEAHIKELAECGVELIVCLKPNSREVLDLLSKYGIGCILTGVYPGWWGGNGSLSGNMRNERPLSLYQKAIDAFADHPAVWGIDIADEPSALDFPYLSELARLTETHFPWLTPYLNLYPNYAAVSQNSAAETENQLGTATYEEHVERYLQEVDLPYLSYDYYLYPQTKNHNVAKMLENFRIVSAACQRTGKRFWYIPQVNDRREDARPSLGMLRYQAYIALCYGATVINWACYCKGWWNHNILDEAGNKTEQYEKLQAMNRELRAIGEPFMKYRTVSTHLLGFEEELSAADFPHLKSLNSFSCGFARNLCTQKAKLVIGQMTHRTEEGKEALLICNASDPCDESPSVCTVSFDSQKRHVAIYSGTEPISLLQKDGKYSFELPTCGGVLITFD